MFLACMAHAGHLSLVQQVRLFTVGLPDPIRTDVELQAPHDLRHMMMLACAYEHCNAVVLVVAHPLCH